MDHTGLTSGAGRQASPGVMGVDQLRLNHAKAANARTSKAICIAVWRRRVVLAANPCAKDVRPLWRAHDRPARRLAGGARIQAGRAHRRSRFRKFHGESHLSSVFDAANQRRQRGGLLCSKRNRFRAVEENYIL